MSQEYSVDGRDFSGYMALPETITQSGILVFHAWWGLNDLKKLNN